MSPFIIEPNSFMIVVFGYRYLEGLPSVAYLEVTGRLSALVNIDLKIWFNASLKDRVVE
jgi:hypothetical protein